MGSSLSKSMDFKIPVEEICPKSDHHFHCETKPKSPHRHPSSRKQESWSKASRHNSEMHHLEDPNHHHKWQKKRAISYPGSITSNPSVLIVNEGESDSNLSYTSELVKTKRYHLDRSLRDFNKEFEDVHVHLENFPNKDEIRRENEKLYNFVTAWKTGLTGYPHERIEKVCSDIPLAATSHCKQGINPANCQRCNCNCLQCTSTEASEHLLEDLVRKGSLDRFLYETEFEQVTSSIVIRQNLKRKRLHDSVKHLGKEGEEEEGVEIEDVENPSHWVRVMDKLKEHALMEQVKKMKESSLRSNEAQNRSAEFKFAKIALMTLSLWFIAWTPSYLIINFAEIFGAAKISPLGITSWGSVFAKCMAIYNPIVYGISHPKYRAALVKKYPGLNCACNEPASDAVSRGSELTTTVMEEKPRLRLKYYFY